MPLQRGRRKQRCGTESWLRGENSGDGIESDNSRAIYIGGDGARYRGAPVDLVST